MPSDKPIAERGKDYVRDWLAETEEAADRTPGTNSVGGGGANYDGPSAGDGERKSHERTMEQRTERDAWARGDSEGQSGRDRQLESVSKASGDARGSKEMREGTSLPRGAGSDGDRKSQSRDSGTSSGGDGSKGGGALPEDRRGASLREKHERQDSERRKAEGKR